MKKSLAALLVWAALDCAAQTQSGVDAVQEPKPKFLTGEELRALFSKKLTVRRTEGGLRATTSLYEPDGTARLEEGNYTFHGSWRIVDNKFCINYSRLGAGCSNILKTGEKTYREISDDRVRFERAWEILN